MGTAMCLFHMDAFEMGHQKLSVGHVTIKMADCQVLTQQMHRYTDVALPITIAIDTNNSHLK